MDQLENYLEGKNLKNLSYYYLEFHLSTLQPRKAMIITQPCSLFHSWICLYKIRFSLLNIFTTVYDFQISLW